MIPLLSHQNHESAVSYNLVSMYIWHLLIILYIWTGRKAKSNPEQQPATASSVRFRAPDDGIELLPERNPSPPREVLSNIYDEPEQRDIESDDHPDPPAVTNFLVVADDEPDPDVADNSTSWLANLLYFALGFAGGFIGGAAYMFGQQRVQPSSLDRARAFDLRRQAILNNILEQARKSSNMPPPGHVPPQQPDLAGDVRVQANSQTPPQPPVQSPLPQSS
jgi:hypothetical protein